MKKFISYAQNLEDVMLWRALKNVEQGLYVDVGANHPIRDSVTKAFYENGWHGVNVEPIRSLYDQLMLDRPRDINLCCAISSLPGTAEFYEIPGACGLSTLERSLADEYVQKGLKLLSYQVPVRTLADILTASEVTKIHFLKIDVEGAEKAVLQSMPFDRVKPWVIVVEATRPNTQIPSHQDWEKLLISNSYSCVYFDGANRYYLSNTHQELAEAFKAPPNAFDNYFQYHAHRELMEELTGVRQELTAHKQRLKEIRTSVSWKLSKPLRGIEHLFALVSRKLKDLFNV